MQALLEAQQVSARTSTGFDTCVAITNATPSSLLTTHVMHDPIDCTPLEEHYFRATRYFPMFAARTVQQLWERLGGNLAWSAVEGALLFLKHQKVDPMPANSRAATASKHLHDALSRAGQLVLETPNLSNLQALLLVVVSIRRSLHEDAHARGSIILAAAIRMANQLKLHILDAATGISFNDRLEMIRVFWCAYILDMENSLRTGEPPLFDDAELYIIEPPRHPVDSCGIVTSLDGQQQVSLFAARQRLARVAGKAHKQLYTFQARHKPTRLRAEAAAKLTEELVVWRQDWFICGLDNDFAQIRRWPPEAHVEIGNLHCTYLLCCSKIQAGTP